MAGVRRVWRKLVEANWAENIATNLGTPSERRLQEARDIERLVPCSLLWDTLQKTQAQPSPHDYRRLAMQAKSMSTRQQRQVVEDCVKRQVLGTASVLHQSLLQAGDAAAAGHEMAAAYERLATGDDDESDDEEQRSNTRGPQAHTASSAPAPAQLTTHAVSQLLKAKLGFSLRVDTSSIQHPEAGLGVFMQGDAFVGSVVAVLPGLFYTRTQLPRMPNYPQISRGNPYLSSRYDSTILDSKPWPQQGVLQVDQSSSSVQDADDAQSYARWALSGVEQRHPLAVGHLINHPPAGSQPNVLEFGWNLELDLDDHPAWLRAYIPVVPGLDLDQLGTQNASVALLRGNKRRKSKLGVVSLRGLALVATRTIKDGEELFQNYRLNPRALRPSWYTSIDPEEDARRWAPLWYAKLL